MKILLPRLTRFLAYYCKKFSKTLYLLKPRNYCTYLLLGHDVVLFALVAALFNLRYLITVKVQCQPTKVILNDYTSDYKSCLIKLQILPLMYV